MIGAEVARDLAERLAHDLHVRFPAVTVSVYEAEGVVVCEVREADVAWGSVGTSVDLDDVYMASEVEPTIAEVVQDMVDNLWPDELTDPWPLCPRHRDHPLQPRLLRGRASWVCARDDAVGVSIGRLVAGE